MPRRLTHDETLDWITARRAWRLAHKTKSIWARPVEAAEVGRPFVTADATTARARAGAWLCVGSVGEPWFQSRDKIDAKYDAAGEESRRFAFDDAPRAYRVFRPRDEVNWAAQIEAPDIEGFYIQPDYPTDGPLYSPAGGYVVRRHVEDPYAGPPKDVWLVQQKLFESTYELID